MPNYNHCPQCGSNQLKIENQTLIVCQNCNYQIYNNPKPTATCVIICENKIMLGKRAHQPHKDEWSFGGGFLDYGESPTEACIREVKEELGIDITNPIMIGDVSHDYEYQGAISKIASTLFLIRIDPQLADQIIPADDVAEIKWVSFGELNSMELAFEPVATNVKQKIFQYLGYLKNANLKQIRTEIDSTDSEIIRLLAKRIQLVKHVAEFKQEHNLSIVNSHRWQEVVSDGKNQANQLGISPEYIEVIWNIIHDESCRIEKLEIQKYTCSPSNLH